MIFVGRWMAIISSRRPSAVSYMSDLCPVATWYVRDEQDAEQYSRYGAAVKIAGTLVAARNQALDDAFAQGLWCVQLSDDLRYITKAHGNRVYMRCTVFEALTEIQRAMVKHNTYLGGAAPSSNRILTEKSPAVSLNRFILGDFMLIRPCDLRFDPNLRLKEDYDYTAQHLAQFGAISRCNSILPEFQHRSNTGGAVDYRTAELEQEAIAYLMQKWPNQFKKGNRPNEIVLNWKGHV